MTHNQRRENRTIINLHYKPNLYAIKKLLHRGCRDITMQEFMNQSK